MGNPLLDKLGGNLVSNGVVGSSAGSNSNSNLVQQFLDFKKNFKGDPKKTLEELVSSGKVSKSQLEDAKSKAMMLKGLLK